MIFCGLHSWILPIPLMYKYLNCIWMHLRYLQLIKPTATALRTKAEKEHFSRFVPFCLTQGRFQSGLRASKSDEAASRAINNSPKATAAMNGAGDGPSSSPWTPLGTPSSELRLVRFPFLPFLDIHLHMHLECDDHLLRSSPVLTDALTTLVSVFPSCCSGSRSSLCRRARAFDGARQAMGMYS